MKIRAATDNNTIEEPVKPKCFFLVFVVWSTLNLFWERWSEGSIILFYYTDGFPKWNSFKIFRITEKPLDFVRYFMCHLIQYWPHLRLKSQEIYRYIIVFPRFYLEGHFPILKFKVASRWSLVSVHQGLKQKVTGKKNCMLYLKGKNKHW